jgi:hypothetical protein
VRRMRRVRQMRQKCELSKSAAWLGSTMKHGTAPGHGLLSGLFHPLLPRGSGRIKRMGSIRPGMGPR